MASFTDRLAHAWDAFSQREPQNLDYGEHGGAWVARPGTNRLLTTNDRSIIGTIYTRLAIDIAEVDMKHARVDANGGFLEMMNSGLNYCLTQEANLDQAARAFRQDIAMSLFDKGVIAIVPTETDLNPNKTGGYDIRSMRVADILAWYPSHIRVSIYNESKGIREELVLPKKICAIVENPLYNVMNEPNSTLQRLIRKLSLMDSADEQSGSGKLDIIIQLPYTIKSEQRRSQAEQRRRDIELQLKGSQYGIAYADATERITQLNRPAENNLLSQVEFLTAQLYSQLGITEEVFLGTASESVMLNYHNRTVAPILRSITEAMKRVFLSRTARTQGQSIEFFRDPFKLVTMEMMADLADKLTRSEVLTSNELRGKMGFMPSKEPKADELHNSNMPMKDQAPNDGASVATKPEST